MVEGGIFNLASNGKLRPQTCDPLANVLYHRIIWLLINGLKIRKSLKFNSSLSTRQNCFHSNQLTRKNFQNTDFLTTLLTQSLNNYSVFLGFFPINLLYFFKLMLIQSTRERKHTHLEITKIKVLCHEPSSMSHISLVFFPKKVTLHSRIIKFPPHESAMMETLKIYYHNGTNGRKFPQKGFYAIHYLEPSPKKVFPAAA